MSEKLGTYILIGQTPVPEPDTVRWGLWFEKADAERQVASDQIGPYRVSTVFLGIDHQFGKGPPLLFETMIFGEKDDELLDYCRRCSTWLEAEEMHRRAVEHARKLIHGTWKITPKTP